MQRPFERLAIVNRGEAAMRLLHAAREINAAAPGERPALVTIALHTETERDAMFVREADEAYCIGPATFVDPTDGERKNGYLDYRALEDALAGSRAEAAWVGWGFVAEHPAFADLCERLGVVFVGPDAAVMRMLGDKIGSKRLAEECGVPVAAWSGGPVETVDEARHAARSIGYPLMIKATAGGGGRGIRRVDSEDQLEVTLTAARSEALKSFGDATVFMERYVEKARHIEVQVVADGFGTAWAVGVRDCSLQRRHQKVVEESASTALTAEQERELRDAAVRLVLRAGYRNAATVEFLYHPYEQSFSFMEVNARLQVEHPVTEVTTGTDLVKLQLHVAAGGRLAGEPPPVLGHAVEVRLNAEDPDRGFAPAPGRVELLRLPTGPGVRVDRGVTEGDRIAPEFDSMIAKIIAWGPDRPAAIARLCRALADTTVVVEGGTTNKGFLLSLLRRPEVASGDFDNAWLDGGEHRSPRGGDAAAVAVLVAAVEAYDEESSLEKARFQGRARRGRPQVGAPGSRSVELGEGGNSYKVSVGCLGPGRYRATVGGTGVDVGVERSGHFERRVRVGGKLHRVVVTAQASDYVVEVDGTPVRVTRDDGGYLRSPAPAVVVALLVEAGDEVEAGATVAVVESMKTEFSIQSPFGGRVREVLARTHMQVPAGGPIVRVEASGAASAGAATEVLDFGRVAALDPESEDPRTRCRENLGTMTDLVLGFDVDDDVLGSLLADHEQVCASLPPDAHGLVEGENRVLRAFADLRLLFRPHHDDDEERVRSSQEYMSDYLRTLDPDSAGLPERFVTQLSAALAHYGVTNLERGPELEEALFRIFCSQTRVDVQSQAVTSILDRRLEHAAALARTDELRALLDHLQAATLGRYPALADLASEVEFRCFDEPLLERAAADAYADAERNLAALRADPDGPDRGRHIDELVACAQPLAPVLIAGLPGEPAPMRQVVLELLARRYYRIRDLGRFVPTTREGRELMRASFGGRGEHEGETVTVCSTHLDFGDLETAARAVAAELAEVEPGDRVVVDLFARAGADATAPDEVAAWMARTLGSVDFGRPVDRFVVAVGRPGTTMDALTHFTFRPGPEGLEEDTSLRGLHPMMAERLQMWRLSNFDIERLPSTRDVYLFHGHARENARDERLFSIAEVRDLTTVRDAAGHLVAVPEMERMFLQALEGIRRFQAHRPPHRRLHWNRVFLYVWPPLELTRDEIVSISRPLARATRGLGIEALLLRCRLRESPGDVLVERVLRLASPSGGDFVVEVSDPPTEPLRPLDEYTRKVVDCRRRGTTYPYELVRTLAPPQPARDTPAGDFAEHDLDGSGQRLVPVDRPAGRNEAGIVVGVARNFTDRYPEGITRVTVMGDPSRALGSIAEPECRRIIAALDLAEEMGVPLEWFAISAGAKIAMDTGTENMDWVASVLRRLVEFTQAGGEVNVVVAGINVGAQPYWNAEATMLMHTRGILVMTPASAMVLTGKQALDYSGGVSAEDNYGIGGYERIMGPNGQAQYWAPDLDAACRVLLRHYEHGYVAPGERFPRRAATTDPPERDPGLDPHTLEGSGFATVADIFSPETNPERKKPFDIRSVMHATVDRDHSPMERWATMSGAEAAVVWDAHVGGFPVTLVGIESHALARHGPLPADGPEQWTAGTLFPKSSKKIARAVNATSGSRPLVVLANLSGFDGSPESMRSLQLEFGAEIGRAIVNFDGPIVFCVVSRYHGGAFVVFSQRLNDRLEAVAVEGSKASVIGGAPAAAVVFGHEVDSRTGRDPRVQELEEKLRAADPSERSSLRALLDSVRADVRTEKQGELASEFDRIHSVERAQQVGSVSAIIAARDLRSYLVDAVERGMARVLAES